VKKNALLSRAAGLVLFVWGFVSWVVLPAEFTIGS
jgi:hypothetical protein